MAKNFRISPQNQFLMSVGAGILNQPYSTTPQGMAGIGNAMNQGLNTYQNAMLLQDTRQDKKDKELEEFNKQTQMRTKFQSSLKGLPLEQQSQLMAGFNIDPGAAWKAGMALQHPEPQQPTDAMRNAEANIQRLNTLGLWDQLSQGQKAAVAGGAPLEKAVPGMAFEYDPESGGFKFMQGPNVTGGGAAGGADGTGKLPEEVADAAKEFEFQDQITDFIFDPLLEQSVGPRFGIMKEKLGIDWLTNTPQYQMRERIIKVLEPQVLAMGGTALKGNQTEREWQMVRDTMPDKNASPEVWRDWYSSYMGFRLKEYDSGSPAYEAMKDQTRQRMLSIPMRKTDAARWLKPGDIFTDRDTGKRMEYLGE